MGERRPQADRAGPGLDFGPFWRLSRDLFCIAGFDGYFKQLSDSWATTLGWSLDELMARPYLEFVHPEDRGETTEQAEGLPNGQFVLSFLNRYRCRDGSYRSLQWNAAPEPTSQLIYAVAHDVTEELSSAQHHNYLAAALAQSAEAIFITDTNGRITYLNRAFEVMTGYGPDEALGERASLVRSGLHPDAYFAEMWRTITSGQVWRGQIHNRRRDGSVYVAKATIAPLRDDQGTITAYVATQQDITAELELHQRLARSQALETAGHLVTGVAHDFRNILAAIRGFAMLLEGAPYSAYLAEAIGELHDLLARGDELTGQLVAFARQEQAEPELTDLNDIVESMARLLRRTLPATIQVRVQPAVPCALAMVVPSRLRQVVLNLALNARDAMPDGGELMLACAQTPDGGARLAVADTGCGMSAEVTKHIFDPFFTTKRDHGGSGIGLATVAEILAAAAATISVGSAVGQGTRFDIEFPSCPQATAALI